MVNGANIWWSRKEMQLHDRNGFQPIYRLGSVGEERPYCPLHLGLKVPGCGKKKPVETG